jgi:hypothetical protein
MCTCRQQPLCSRFSLYLVPVSMVAIAMVGCLPVDRSACRLTENCAARWWVVVMGYAAYTVLPWAGVVRRTTALPQSRLEQLGLRCATHMAHTRDQYEEGYSTAPLHLDKRAY